MSESNYLITCLMSYTYIEQHYKCLSISEKKGGGCNSGCHRSEESSSALGVVLGLSIGSFRSVLDLLEVDSDLSFPFLTLEGSFHGCISADMFLCDSLSVLCFFSQLFLEVLGVTLDGFGNCLQNLFLSLLLRFFREVFNFLHVLYSFHTLDGFVDFLRDRLL